MNLILAREEAQEIITEAKEALGYNFDIQPQPYTMKDYFERTGIVDDILKTGIELQ